LHVIRRESLTLVFGYPTFNPIFPILSMSLPNRIRGR
jgi:hypothetical protein